MYEVAKSLEAEAIPRLGPKGIFPNVDFILVLFIENLVFLVIYLLQFLPYLEWLVG